MACVLSCAASTNSRFERGYPSFIACRYQTVNDAGDRKEPANTGNHWKKELHVLPRKMKTSSSNKCQGEDDLPSDDDSEPRERNKPSDFISPLAVERAFGCPYYMRRPPTDSWSSVPLSPEASNCSNCRLRSIRSVKRHLSMIHRRPKFLCKRCSECFDNEQKLQAHNSNPTPCGRGEDLYQDSMSQEQESSIAWVRDGRAGNEGVEENWYQIYGILFPDASLPASPYHSYVMSEKLPERSGFSRKNHARNWTDGATNNSPQPRANSNHSTHELNVAVPREIVEEARHEILRQWARHNLILGVQSDILQAMDQEETSGDGGHKKRKATSSSRGKFKKTEKRGRPPTGAGDNDENLSDGDGGDSNEEETTQKPPDPPEADKQMMCPYYWFDSDRYSRHNIEENEYRRCESAKMSSISRLKYHLWRVHTRPDFYCGRCFVIFKSQEAMVDHLQEETPCDRVTPKKFQERMTPEQHKTLKEHRFHGSIAESYRFICQVLFPSEPPPASPYHTDHPVIPKPFFRTHLPAILRQSCHLRNLAISAQGINDIIEDIIRGLEEARQSPLLTELETVSSTTTDQGSRNISPQNQAIGTDIFPFDEQFLASEFFQTVTQNLFDFDSENPFHFSISPFFTTYLAVGIPFNSN